MNTSLRDYLSLVRLPNLLFIAIILYVMEKWVAVPLIGIIGIGEQLPWWLLAMLMLSTMLIAAGGYVINDYFDVKIDRINRPDQIIVTRTITREQAMHIFIGLSAAGILLGAIMAWLLHSGTLALIYVIMPGLLWFYSASYKRQFVVGNLIIALSSAMVPLLVAIANIAALRQNYSEAIGQSMLAYHLYLWMGGFAVFAFLTTWIREVVKDLQDQKGDREMECHTMPIRMGVVPTKIFVTLLILLTVGLLTYLNFYVLPFPHAWDSLSTRYWAFGLVVPFCCELWLLWSARRPSEYKNAQNLMKFIMMLGVLYSFVVLKQL